MVQEGRQEKEKQFPQQIYSQVYQFINDFELIFPLFGGQIARKEIKDVKVTLKEYMLI